MYLEHLIYGIISISCECEKCGKPFNYTQTLEGDVSDQRSNYVGPGIFAENLGKKQDELQKMKDEIFSTYLGIETKKCPACGYNQSWMLKTNFKKKKDRIITVLVIIVFFTIFCGLVVMIDFDSIPLFKDTFVKMMSLLTLLALVYGAVSFLVERLYKDHSVAAYPAKTPVLTWELINTTTPK